MIDEQLIKNDEHFEKMLKDSGEHFEQGLRFNIIVGHLVTVCVR